MSARRYAFANVVLESTFPIPELPPSDRPRATCTVDLAPGQTVASGALGRSGLTIRGGGPRGNDGFAIEFAATARFDVSAAGDAIVCTPIAGASPTTVCHLLVDQVLPRVLFLRGALVLHASALRAPDGRAVAFLGASGSGKTTLAASLIGAGWSLLSDDALVIERGDDGPTVVPTYPDLRLRPDVAAWIPFHSNASQQQDGASKVRIRADRLGDVRPFSTAPVPLARVHVVETEAADVAAAPQVKEIAPGDGLRKAFDAEFRLAPPDRPSLQASFDRIAASGVLPLFRSLSYPRVREVLPALHAEIRRDLVGA
jgi:hypothetical protein